MKKGPLLAIGAALIAGLIAWYFASIDHVLVGPPQANEVTVAPSSAPAGPGRSETGSTLSPAGVLLREGKPVTGLSPVVALGPAAPQQNVGEAPELSKPSPNGAMSEDAGARYALNKDGISSAVKAALPEMKECYESWHQLDPSLQGRMKVSFVLSGDGGEEASVEQVHVMDDAGMGHVAFEGCVLSVFSSLHFDAPAGGGNLTVNYPIMFSPADAGP